MVLPPTRGAERGLASLRVAGLPLVRRLVLAAAAAGYARVFVDDDVTAAAEALDGTAAAGLKDASLAPSPARRRVVLVPVNVLAQRRWLRERLETPLQAETLHVDASRAAVVETERPDKVLAAVRGAGAGEALDRLRATFGEAREDGIDLGDARARDGLGGFQVGAEPQVLLHSELGKHLAPLGDAGDAGGDDLVGG